MFEGFFEAPFGCTGFALRVGSSSFSGSSILNAPFERFGHCRALGLGKLVEQSLDSFVRVLDLFGNAIRLTGLLVHAHGPSLLER